MCGRARPRRCVARSDRPRHMSTASDSRSVTDFRELTRRWLPLALLVLGVIVVIGLALLRPAGAEPFPAAWNLGLRAPVDSLQSWVIGNRATHPIFRFFFDPL